VQKFFDRGIMMEGGDYNIEVAQHLSERRKSSSSVGHEILEIIEAVLLAVVAVSTAWTGYQAALWNGHQSELYGLASRRRVQASQTFVPRSKPGRKWTQSTIRLLQLTLNP
jgi:hypothetical protein